MISSRFEIRVLAALLILFALMLTLAFAVLKTSYVVTPLLLGVATILQASVVVRLVRTTNRKLATFFVAASHADFSQGFVADTSIGAGFPEMEKAMSRVAQQFGRARQSQERQQRYLQSLLEQVPMPLLSVWPAGKVELVNRAARRLMSGAKVTRVEDLDQFGSGFARALLEQPPGQRRVVEFHSDSGGDQMTVSVTELRLTDSELRLISLANIQSELEATELAAWQQLVRVLTHEIMNSVTPISSLAHTAADLIGQAAEPTDIDLAGAREAVATLARRSDRLMSFVNSYRSLTRLPEPKRSERPVMRLFDEMVSLHRAEFDEAGIELSADVNPVGLTLNADHELLEQVLINLLANSVAALKNVPDPRVQLNASLSRANQVVIEVMDNGEGIAPDLVDQVFVPFFTTKVDGTGVGLALTRQILRAHGGRIVLLQPEQGGTLFRLIL